MTYNPKITVCDKCFRACCWQGEFMCDDAYEAGIVDLPVSDLIEKQGHEELEHPHWWNRDLHCGNKQLLTEADLRGHGITDPDMLDLEDSEVIR